MAEVIAHLATSPDGFIADPDDGCEELFGFYQGGDVAVKLSEGFPELHVSQITADLPTTSVAATGATVVGRRDPGQPGAGDPRRRDPMTGWHPWPGVPLRPRGGRGSRRHPPALRRPQLETRRTRRAGQTMNKAVLSMSISLDGFIAGPNVAPGNGLGDGGHRLHEWFLTDTDAGHKGGISHLTGVNREVMHELMSTGAVVVGRRTFELAGGWGGDHHDGVPIFVLSRQQPDPTMQWPAVTYVSDVASAMHLAKDAAGEKDVLVHGACTAQLALAAGVLDELQIHLIPVLLGQGQLLFEDMPPDHIELELLRALDGNGVLHLRYRVRPEG